ncbi:MAG: GDP-mannose 4,6-dehydratase [Isosphaeraceae bacterium]
MRALVTGASGFVGGHLCEHLVAEGDHAVGLSVTGRWPSDLAHLGQAVRIEKLDLVAAAETALAGLIDRERPEVIYHLAAQSNPQQSVADPRGTWAANLGGTLNLLEAVKSSGLKPRVIVVGTGTSYGDPAPEFIPVREDCPLRPNNPYAASKAAVDLLGIQHHLGHKTDIVIARPFNHAGPRQSPRYVLAALAAQVAAVEAGRQECVEVGNLDVTRDLTDVRDVVRGYRLLAARGKPGEIYNLGSGRGTRILDALEHLRSLATRPIPVRVDPARVRPVDLPYLIADPGKLRAAVGWEPAYPIEQTLADMLESCRQTEARAAT